MLQICAVGGYDEVGRNCTAIRVDNEVILLDMGLHMENYINLVDEEDTPKVTLRQLSRAEAIPDMNFIRDWNSKVTAIVPTHAHLDHVGAIPYLSNKYDAQIICTPFTAEVIEATVKDHDMHLDNELLVMETGASVKVGSIEIEFVSMTHSTPHTATVVLHTKYGRIVYANDFKFDMYPVLGKKPDIKRLAQLGTQGVLALIADSTYSNTPKKTPSESVARQMLREVMVDTESKGRGLIVTTFSSHIARLKSIVEFGKKINRKIVFLGRSLSKYVEAAEAVGLVKFSDSVDIVRYGKKIGKRLRGVQDEGKEKYLLVVTGHQGESKATLSKMVDGKFKFNFDENDHVIFSCTVIPTESNKESRRILDEKLKEMGVRLFTDIHASGHGAREDLRELLTLLKPEHVIPSHGDLEKRKGFGDLANSMGWSRPRIHLMDNGKRINLA